MGEAGASFAPGERQKPLAALFLPPDIKILMRGAEKIAPRAKVPDLSVSLDLARKSRRILRREKARIVVSRKLYRITKIRRSKPQARPLW
jgi:hypothetical protein